MMFYEGIVVFQVSITLETSETISRRFVHPSRRNAPTITKVNFLSLHIDTDMMITVNVSLIPCFEDEYYIDF